MNDLHQFFFPKLQQDLHAKLGSKFTRFGINPKSPRQQFSAAGLTLGPPPCQCSTVAPRKAGHFLPQFASKNKGIQHDLTIHQP